MKQRKKGRPRKFTTVEVQAAAADRRSGMTWEALSVKYKCAVNTIRESLYRYSDEFCPNDPPQRSELSRQLHAVQSRLDKIEKALKKRFNLHI